MRDNTVEFQRGMKSSRDRQTIGFIVSRKTAPSYKEFQVDTYVNFSY